jgi:hypothetical protein
MKERRCRICYCLLNQPGQPDTRDCGGDCLKCMAEAGDPECIAAMRALAQPAAPQGCPGSIDTKLTQGTSDHESK